MCGIAGCIGRDPESLDAMMSQLVHRGPDSSGTYITDAISLGHRRLSIQDLSENGKQPMIDPFTGTVIVFNGEVYNFRELRAELARDGHEFVSHSDTEVLLLQYRKEGIRCLSRLEGMFSIAIWDVRERKLHLVRDRLGKKPMYYYHSGDTFVFASEIKSLLKHRAIHPALNTQATASLLMLRYGLSPETVIEGVKKLSPGTMLTFAPGRGEPVMDRFWHLPTDTLQLSEKEATEELLRLLRHSVTQRLISDVPVGAMLSGGIDSGAVCALAAETHSNLKTFSIGFAGATDNEFSRAAIMAKAIGSKHREILVSTEHSSLLPEVIWHNDEPVAGPSSMAYYVALRETKKEATVLLLGHGADEVLAGYEELKILNSSRVFASALLNLPARAASGIMQSFFPSNSSFNRLTSYIRALKDIHSAPERSFFNLVAVCDKFEMGSFLKDSLQASQAEALILQQLATYFRGKDLLNGVLTAELQTWLPEDILLRVDRMTMAASIEGRVPFLDHKLVEFLHRLPIHYKLGDGVDKLLLRNAMRGILPEIIRTQKKQRFNTPVHHFLADEIDTLCRKIFSEENYLNSTFFNGKALLALLDYKKSASYRLLLKHNKLTGQYYARQIWNILVFQLWYKMYFEGETPESINNKYHA